VFIAREYILKKSLLILFAVFNFTIAFAQETPEHEPLFNDFKRTDLEMNNAFALASATINDFEKLVIKGGDASFMAKLRFIDPRYAESQQGVEVFYIWLSDVVFHSKENMFSGVFFELPNELKEWHHVGQRLGFDKDDVFDWMVNENGHVKGAFTLRVTRSRLKTDAEKKEFDEYTGMSSYEEY